VTIVYLSGICCGKKVADWIELWIKTVQWFQATQYSGQGALDCSLLTTVQAIVCGWGFSRHVACVDDRLCPTRCLLCLGAPLDGAIGGDRPQSMACPMRYQLPLYSFAIEYKPPTIAASLQ